MKVQRESVRNLAARLFGLAGQPSIEDVDELMVAVCELGRRGEFDLLKEQGIIPWHACRSRTAAAGQFPHVYVMASSLNATGTRHHVVVERATFSNGGGGIMRAFVGTSLGSTVSALVIARDARFTDNMRTDFSALVQVQDGETAVVPPAVGAIVWDSTRGANTENRWDGPQLVRNILETAGVQDQLAFQLATVAGVLTYTIYGYLVPIAGEV